MAHRSAVPRAGVTPGSRADPASPAGLRERLVPPMPGRVAWGWAGPLLVTVFGGLLRLDQLTVPHGLVFDEVYYVPDAWSMLRHGVEVNHSSHVSALLARGDTHVLLGTQAELVAHPPLGKLMMAVGQWLFGLTPFGWRFSVALIGTLSILLLARIVRRMTRSTLLGCIAGLLMALDGLELVLSRTAILDIFVMFWALAAFGLIVIDRDRTRARLADAAAAGRAGPRGGPRLGVRWLLVGAGACLGAAVACKWNGVWFIFAFAGLVIAWDLGARRAAGYTDRLAGVARSDGPWIAVWFAVVPAIVYIASWTGWFATPYGYDRNGAVLNNRHPTSVIPAWLADNRWMLHFGVTLTSTTKQQPYLSDPLGWTVLARPISFLYQGTHGSSAGCGARSCSQEVLAIGTPLIWWGGTAALVFCLAWWLMRRDWRSGAILLAVAAGWLPWIWFYLHDQRTEFYYYAIAFEPFLIIAITLCLGLIIGPTRASPARRAIGAVTSGTYLLAVVLNLAYLYPILVGSVIPWTAWHSRMWLPGWI